MATFAYGGGDENVHQHYSVTQTSSSSDSTGTSYSAVTVYDVDLTIDATVNADGTWTYTEDVISSYTLTVTAAGASLPSSSGSGTFDYDFSASGSATLSQFNYSCSGSDHESGSSTQSLTSSDADGLTTTETVNEHWTNDDHYGATITNTTDLTTSAATGTAIENEGATAATSSSGTYSYPIEGGTVNGTTSESGVQHNSLYASWTISRADDGTVTASGSGSAHEDTSGNESYQGSGSYTVTTSGSDGYIETDTGTVTESGNSASSAQETVGFTIASDGSAWNQTSGSGSTHDSGAHHYDEAGGGVYSYQIEGGTVSGTTRSSGDEHGSYGFITKSSFLAGGWSSTGSGSASETSASQNSYSGKGTYTVTSTSSDGYTETVSGTVAESGNSAFSANETVGYALATDGSSWLETTGSGSTHGDSKDDYSYSGSGTYSHPIAGGTVTGTIKEHGYNSTSDDEHTHSLLTGGAWSTTGSASDTVASGDQSSCSGSGTYSGTVTGASGYTETISGTVTENAASSDAAEENEGFTLSASGSWVQTSGSGYTNETSNDDSSYSGAGTYSYQVEGGSVSGTVQESGHNKVASAFGTLSAFDGGQWITVGAGRVTASSGDQWSYQGNGTYSAVSTGSGGYLELLSGTITESGGSSNSFNEKEGFTLTASGSWSQTTGSGNSNESDSNDESYSGGGAYDYPVPGGTVTGTLKENGYADDAGHFSATSNYTNGAWITEGSGSSMVHSGDFDSYQGGGSYTRTDTGDGGYTDTVEGTITENGNASNIFYQRKEYLPGASGSWNQTSGSGYTSNRSADNFSYVGNGTYQDPAEGTTGTVNENGHNNRTSNFSTDSSYQDETWTTTGKGKNTLSSGHNDSYSGGGTISVGATSSGGPFQATLTEYSSSGFADDETDGYTLNAAGSWAQSSGTANTTWTSAQGQAVSASTPYQHAMASGTIDGTAQTKMGWGVTGAYTIHGDFDDGQWENSGKGTVINSTFSNASYDGSGAFTSQATGASGATESLEGTMYENGHSDGAFQESDYFTLVVPPPDGEGSTDASWSQSGGLKTYTASIENNASYSGTGDYSHAVPGGTVSGTVIEGGQNDKSSALAKYVKYNGGVWATSSGSASKTSSSGAHCPSRATASTLTASRSARAARWPSPAPSPSRPAAPRRPRTPTISSSTSPRTPG